MRAGLLSPLVYSSVAAVRGGTPSPWSLFPDPGQRVQGSDFFPIVAKKTKAALLHVAFVGVRGGEAHGLYRFQHRKRENAYEKRNEDSGIQSTFGSNSVRASGCASASVK